MKNIIKCNKRMRVHHSLLLVTVLSTVTYQILVQPSYVVAAVVAAPVDSIAVQFSAYDQNIHGSGLLLAADTEADTSSVRRPKVRRTGQSTNPETVEPAASPEVQTEQSATATTEQAPEQAAEPATKTSTTTQQTVQEPVQQSVQEPVQEVSPPTVVTEPAPELVVPKPIPQVTPQTTPKPVPQTVVTTPAKTAPAKTVAPVTAPVPVASPVPTPVPSTPDVTVPETTVTTIPVPKPQRQETPTATVTTTDTAVPDTTTEKPVPVPAPVITKEAAPTIQTQVKRPRRETQQPAMQTPVATQPATAAPATSMMAGQKRRELPRVDFDSMGTHTAIDRWRIVDALGYPRDALDPYNTNNPLKADRPMSGTQDWFFDLSAISDTLYETRYVPLPVGVATTNNPGSYDTLGSGDQTFINQNLEFEFVLYKGDSIYKPPEFEFRFVPVMNYNRLDVDEIGVVKVNPKDGSTRTESFVGIQGLYADVHLRDVSSRYDFDSLRVGIQPFNADFRGFLFLDRPFGVRLFGTRDNNIFQYNFAWLKRFDKDINSGLNDISEMRDDDIFVGNLYWQDMPMLGFTSQFTILHNRNTEGDSERYDENGFIQRPASLFEERGGRDYSVTYLGYNGDGHVGRINLDASFYYALGTQNSSTVRSKDIDISAVMTAVEASIDSDWMRFRLSGFYASGDEDPFDDVAQGFDAVLDNPTFAGSDSSYYLRQGTPFIGGGGVALSQRNSILNNLKTSKEQGQSNFVNPGVVLLGIGADWDILPTLRITANVNQLWFENTAVLQVLRQQANIDKDIGLDLSVQAIYRPLLSQNIVLQFSYATLRPGNGYIQLFGDNEYPSAIVANLILTY